MPDEPIRGERARRLGGTFLLGFASGLPRALAGGTLTYFLSKAGVAIETVGLFALVASPYTWKFLWAPLFELTPPAPFARLGRRRGWLALVQVLLAAAIFVAGTTDPSRNAFATAAASLAIALFSASQDVLVDGLRVESLAERDQGWGAALTQWGYRVGMMASGYGALRYAGKGIEGVERYDHAVFQTIYAALAVLAVLGMAGTFLSIEPATAEREATEDGGKDSTSSARGSASPDGSRAGGWLLEARRALAAPAEKVPFAVLVPFLVVFRLGDAWAGQLTNTYVTSAGFTAEQIADVTKLVGVLATVIGAGVGGFLLARVAAHRALPFAALLMAVSNLAYAWLATRGDDVVALAVAVVVENGTSGIGGAVTIAFLSSLCTRGRAATQYALLTALLSASATHLAAVSGYLQAACQRYAAAHDGASPWVLYFVLTALAGLPGIVLALVIARLPSLRSPA